MNRKDFIKNIATLSLATPFLSTLLTSCGKQGIDFFPDFEVNFNGKVLIVGAGAAGLTAGHILEQYGIDFQIIEASSVFGGRVKKTGNFADFPIDLGAEWIHTEPSILGKLLNDPSTSAEIETIVYNPKTISIWKNGKLKNRNIANHFYSEYKFKNTTWFDFFDQYIVPNISDKIVYNSPITEIDYSTNKVILTNSNGDTFDGDKVLVTVPISILKNEYINFQPALPNDKINALENVEMPDGLKVFIEFSERFYPDILLTGGLISALNEDDKIFYDAAFEKDSQKNIMGLFTIGSKAAEYVNLSSEQAIIDKILNELDEIFDGKASPAYQKHIIQNWSKEPFIQGSYSHYDDYSAVDVLQTPIDNKVFFAGEALGGDAQSTVHGAGESSYFMIEKILKG